MNAPVLGPSSPRLFSLATGPQGSYRASSDELSRGLEVRALSISELPADLVRELLRLRRAWGIPAGEA